MAREAALTIENAQIRFLNFSGEEQRYNRAGDRNFCVFIDEDLAAQLDRDGWNVKMLKPREEGDKPQPYLQVTVGYKVKPPRIVMIGETSRRRTELGEDLVGLLDSADIVLVDLSINPYHWEVNGDTGITAYLKSMYVTIEEDFLELKYAEMD